MRRTIVEIERNFYLPVVFRICLILMNKNIVKILHLLRQFSLPIQVSAAIIMKKNDYNKRGGDTVGNENSNGSGKHEISFGGST
jgi:hypothetical protein